MHLPSTNSTASHHRDTATSLSTLHNRHTAAAQDYQQLLSQFSDEGELKEMISSLVNYHKEMTTNIKQVLKGFPDIPVRPNKDMSSTYTSLGEISTTAVEMVAKTCHAYEEDVMAIYKELLGNKGIPEEVYNVIEANSERVQDVSAKLERIAKAGAARDMNV